jgi:hypothetical protein
MSMKICAMAGTTGGLILACAVAMPIGTAEAQDQSSSRTRTLTRSVKAGQEVGLGFAVRWNAKCEPVLPKLTIAKPPSHGSLCGRAITVTPQKNVTGDDQTCVGKRMRALQLVYMPSSDYSGADTVDYIIELPRVQLTTHVDIQVIPNDAATKTLIPNNESAPGKAGDAIVPCAPHMSQTTNNRVITL